MNDVVSLVPPCVSVVDLLGKDCVDNGRPHCDVLCCVGCATLVGVDVDHKKRKGSAIHHGRRRLSLFAVGRSKRSTLPTLLSWACECVNVWTCGRADVRTI